MSPLTVFYIGFDALFFRTPYLPHRFKYRFNGKSLRFHVPHQFGVCRWTAIPRALVKETALAIARAVT